MFSKTEIKHIQKEIHVDDAALLKMFDALRDKARLRILLLLTKHTEVCVTDIANIFGVSLPAASRQLKILEQAGIAEKERNGQVICYSLNRKNPLTYAIMKLILNQPL